MSSGKGEDGAGGVERGINIETQMSELGDVLSIVSLLHVAECSLSTDSIVANLTYLIDGPPTTAEVERGVRELESADVLESVDDRYELCDGVEWLAVVLD